MADLAREDEGEVYIKNKCSGCGIRIRIKCLLESGIRNRFFVDPGYWISDPGSQTHIFESLVTIFWAKRCNNFLSMG
jgi:hypothetical protein